MRAILGPRPYEAEEQLALLLEGQGRTSMVSKCIKYHQRSSRIWFEDVSSIWTNQGNKQSRNQETKPNDLRLSTSKINQITIERGNYMFQCSAFVAPFCCFRALAHTTVIGSSWWWNIPWAQATHHGPSTKNKETSSTQLPVTTQLPNPQFLIKFQPHLEKVNMPFS